MDTTFGNNKNGIVLESVGIESYIFLAIQDDGKIIAAGSVNNGIDYDFKITRYNSDGTADNSFGTNGITTTEIGNVNDFPYSVKLQKDGKILVAGDADLGLLLGEFTLARYTNSKPLPVELVSFSGSAVDNKVKLNCRRPRAGP